MNNIIFLKNDGKRKIATLPITIGDVVKISNANKLYTTYDNAYKHFKIENYTNHDNGIFHTMTLRYKESSLNKNWVVMDFAMHEFFEDEYIALVKNCHNEFLVIEHDGLKLVDTKKRLNIYNKGVFYQIQSSI